MLFKEILEFYPLHLTEYTVTPVNNGLINHTWKVEAVEGSAAYILQSINTHIFKHPEHIASNIRRIADYVHKNCPDYLLVSPLQTIYHEEMVQDSHNMYFRLFPFIPHSHSIDVVSTTQQAYEAARQFGKFTKLLRSFNIELLKTTLPDFHNLSLRYYQFKEAIRNGDKERMAESAEVIQYLQAQKNIVNTFEAIKRNPQFKQRVTHHDTKISNVLFDAEDKGSCVIDLDTVMPGYFISDVGDMVRTYLSPASEEETDLSKMVVREDFFNAIADGYLSEMRDELSEREKAHFVYAGKFMIYMQAIRFLTDYLNKDVYYGSKYEGHNLIRAKNQTVLLQKLIEKEKVLKEMNF